MWNKNKCINFHQVSTIVSYTHIDYNHHHIYSSHSNTTHFMIHLRGKDIGVQTVSDSSRVTQLIYGWNWESHTILYTVAAFLARCQENRVMACILPYTPSGPLGIFLISKTSLSKGWLNSTSEDSQVALERPSHLDSIQTTQAGAWVCRDQQKGGWSPPNSIQLTTTTNRPYLRQFSKASLS